MPTLPNWISASRRLGRRVWPKRRRARLLVFGALAVVVGWSGLHLVEAPRFEVPYSTVVFAADGSLLSASIASDGQWRFPLQTDLPPRYVAALKVFEDENFDWHPGIDPIAVARALYLNIRHGRVVSGASTLTMQVVRLSRPGQPRSLAQKLLESVLAMRLEMVASKADILALYATHAPYGGNAVGIEAASWRYLGRGPAELTWAEAATLAVLPNSPALLHPGRNRGPLRTKRDRLLSRLHDEGLLDADELALALAEELPGKPKPVPQLAPHLLASLQQRGRTRTTTTLDADLTRRSLDVLRSHQVRLKATGVHNLAAVVLENKTGAVIAYHGNLLIDGQHEDYVDVATAPRSTGSVLKPFLYEAMLAEGELLPTQLVADVPLRIGGFSPQNFDRRFAGAVPADVALAQSLNVPAVAMLRDFGVAPFHGRLRSLGLSTLNRPASDYGLSLVVGGAEGRLIDLAGAYATLARAALGTPAAQVKPWFFDAERTPPQASVVEPESAWSTLEALVQVKRPGAEGSWRMFPTSRRIAWKTGTSFGFRDAWALGVTPRFTVAVWAGNADGEGRPGLTGRRAAAPVLFDLFGLLPGQGSATWFATPPGMGNLLVCAESGMRAGPDCPHTTVETVPAAGHASRPCRYCRQVHLDRDRALRVDSDCEAVHAMRHEKWFVLPARQEVFFRRRHANYKPLPAFREDCRPAIDGSRMALLDPKPNSQVFVPLELDGQRGRAVFEAAHSDDVEIHWHLDANFLGTTRHVHEIEVAPVPGQHMLTLVDATGARIERAFTVLTTEEAGSAAVVPGG